METVQARVQEAISNLMTKLDREHLRKIQKNMYQCSAACCDKDHYNMEEVQRCVEQCSEPISKTQSFIETEMSHFQNRLQRCAMDCQDKARDQVSSTSSEAEISAYRGQMEKCVIKCADDHVGLIPNMLKRMQEVLKAHH
ncbi:hypothetical protein NP493_1930g00015 [Ridgeia piscesae]|uniref:Protein FAM136A n=1 Tax=Ridgeia piscesae TaxID=27915 RepID=A0AAD9N6J9_RIDPI|nr:hypothetical protein NP493_1930g00015 [Ridgeia piscesae]